MKYTKKQIIKLRKQGLSYRAIAKIVGCSRGIAHYYGGEGNKEKNNEQSRNYQRKWHPFKTKLITFKGKGNYKGDLQFEIELQQLISNFESNPICYLTGDIIDISKTNTYHFDHIIPIALGGSRTIDNLGIATKSANFAKRDMVLNDFILLCKKVVDRHLN